MKRILLASLAMLASLASAATLAPVQLLNPAGSTAGQAIVSSGPSTAPAWGNVTATALAPVAANTVIANATGSAAAPTAHAVPSCSTANSALKYTSGTGLSCGTTFAQTSGNLSQFASTTSAQLAGVLSDETGSGAAVFGTSPAIASPTLSGTVAGAHTYSGAVTFTSTITPSQTAGIVGTTTNNNANAGSVGQYVTNSASGVSLTTGTLTNVTTISLTAGDWDVSGWFRLVGAGGAAITNQSFGPSTVSATLDVNGNYFQLLTSGLGTNATTASGLPTLRVSISGTTTVYCVGYAEFGSGSATATCLLRARRVR